MATIALSLVGQMAGAAIGGPFGANIGRALGALAGSVIDNQLFGEKPQTSGIDVRLQGSSEGVPIPRLYGWSRLSGNIIWATELEEIDVEASGAKGSGASERGIAASFAIGLCEGEVHRLGRVWADGQLLELSDITVRFYRGTEGQAADSLIEAKQGEDAPAYRGLCYLVFERLPLAQFGNRIPNISVELCRVVGELEPSIRAVTMIPGATEFGYDPTARLRLVGGGVTLSENAHAQRDESDWTVSVDELTALCPNLEHVALVVAWFGDDLRCGECWVRPRVEASSRNIEGTGWSVAGYTRGTAQLVTQHEGGPAYGGTPSDNAVKAAIADLKARGIGVTLYPIVMMDIAPDNPMGQPAYPWRGRIACADGDDGTGAAASQVAAFADEYRDFILHYAALAEEAGGVEAFVIGSELRGLTQIRGTANSFPFVEALVDLAADVRAVVGIGTALTYAADWSEFAGHQPGGGEKFFHLDPLWASDDIDVIGIDNYMPLADMREGSGPYAADEMQIESGEGFDWYYADDAARLAGTRTPITDGAYGEPWVWRFKDIASWWSEAHHNRPGGVRAVSPTAWVPQSKPIWFTELGCGAIHRGANQPNVFLDPKSSESFAPHFSNGTPDALQQRQVLRAQLDHWEASPMVERIYLWTWDARPYPAFPALTDVWSDGGNHATGHWLTGRLGAMASDELARAVAADHGVTLDAVEPLAPLIHGYVLDAPITARQALEPLIAATGASLRAGVGGLSIGMPDPEAPLAIDDVVAGEGAMVRRRRPDAGEAIARVGLAYTDRERDFQSGAVTALLAGAGALQPAAVPFVLDNGGARRVAEQMLALASSQRETVEFALPPSALALETGDCVTLGGELFEISEIRDGLVRRINARAVLPELEVALAGGRSGSAVVAPVPRSIPMIEAAHLPPSTDDVTHTRLAVAAYASPWPGAVEVTHELSGASLLTLPRAAAMGVLTAPLAAGSIYLWDTINAIELTLARGHLADRDEGEVLAGANRIAVRTDDGGREIIGFVQAELIAPRSYRLTRLLRGQGGTDHAMGAAAPGNPVIVLDAQARIEPVPPEWLGGEVDLRCFAGPRDPVGVEVSVDTSINAILPLRPVHLQAVRQGSGDIALSWVRRSRADTDSWVVEDSPLDYAPEGYRVAIYAGPVLKRSIDVATQTATYAASQQTADFGGPAAGFGWRVAQKSAVYGPGHWAEAEYAA